MTTRRNYTISNQTTGINTHTDLLATEATLKQIQTSLNGVSSLNTSDTITHTKLSETNVHLDNIENSLNDANDTLTNIFGKTLNSAVDSVTAVVPNLNFATDSVNVVETVQSIPYDLDLLGEAMYADSVSFPRIDPYGRQGWFWYNTATTGGSNCYWYNNTVSEQNHMAKGQIECAYVVMSLDKTEPAIVLPIFVFYSAPTGIDDHIPGFAHSVWTYTIPATHILNVGEVVMLTVGDHTKVANIQPELRRVHLELSVASGQCGEAELINFMTLNTDSGLKDIASIQYLLKNAGFHYVITDKTIDYVFNNSLQKKIDANLAGLKGNADRDNIYVSLNTTSGSNSLSTNLNSELKTEVVQIHNATLVDTEAIKVYTVNGGGGGSGGLVQIQGYNGVDWENVSVGMGSLAVNDYKIHNATDGDTEAIKTQVTNSVTTQLQAYEGTGWANLTSTSGALNTTDSATTSLDGKVFNATGDYTEAIKVYTVNGGSSSSTIQAVLPSALTTPVPLSARTYNDGTYDHYQLETYDNVLNTKIFNATLVDTEAIKVYTVNGGGSGSSGLVQLQAYNSSTSAYEDLKTTATGSLLQVQARTHDATGNDISSTVVNTVRGLNVSVVGNDNLGSVGNIHTGTLTSGSGSTGLNIANTYLNNCVLLYEDASTSLTTGLAIQVSLDNTVWMTLAVLYPTTAQSGKRAVSSALKLKPFPYIRILNIGASSYTTIVCSLFSS